MSALDPLPVATPQGVHAVFTTRAGGVSPPPFDGLNLSHVVGDDEDAVRANRLALCAALGIDPGCVAMLRQVHGVEVVTPGPVPGPFTGALGPWPDGDALVTTEVARPLVVLGADCPPVLLWRRSAGAVAAAHAGWKGLVGGVVEAAVAALGDPSDTAAAIGPGVAPCCYPVSAEVRDAFRSRFGEEVAVGEAVDLSAAARAALRVAGVPDGAVAVLGACTSCDTGRFFSHRRDGAGSGRHAGVIWRDA